ncbi:hypothetical protein Tco_1024318 [Tanacetum coccineum]
MEEASLHTTRKHLFIFTQYYDKHGVPPTKRLFKVAMLDPSPEFIGHGECLEIWDYQLWAVSFGVSSIGSDIAFPYTSLYGVPRWVFNDIKFLEQQNPPEQSWLSILLSKQCNVLEPRSWFCLHSVYSSPRVCDYDKLW